MYPIVKVLEKTYEVEVIGPVFGKEIFSPYKDEFRYKPVIGGAYPHFVSSIRQIIKEISGDIVYAFKPRPTSFGVGLLNKLIRKKPLFLDIEDWEYGAYLQSTRLNLVKNFVLTVKNPNGVFVTYAMEKLVRFADEVFVVSDFLQQKFGGVKLPHGADTNFFDPSRYDGRLMREQWNLLDEKIIMFCGTPRDHKGLEELVWAVKRNEKKNVKLMIIGGDQQNRYVQMLIKEGGDSVVVTGYQPHSEIPRFLSMADLVVLPQKKTFFAMAQIPGKVFEAMAMAKPIIATKVSDLPKILDGCGLLVEPENISELSDKISFLLENEDFARKMGEKARKKCIDKYSWDAMQRILARVFRKYE